MKVGFYRCKRKILPITASELGKRSGVDFQDVFADIEDGDIANQA